jgi:hypothetical protein
MQEVGAMRRLPWLCLLALVPAGPLQAAPCFSNGKMFLTFAELKAAAPCSVGPFEFSNFASSLPDPITEENVIVTPVIDETGVGLRFSLDTSLNAPAVGTNSLTISYDVKSLGFLSAFAEFDGTRNGIGTEASLTETVGGVTISLSAANGPLKDMKAIADRPTTISVSQTASASNAMLNGGTASVSMIVNTFQAVPEPSTLLLGGAGVALTGLASLWRRHRNG